VKGEVHMTMRVYKVDCVGTIVRSSPAVEVPATTPLFDFNGATYPRCECPCCLSARKAAKQP
jgi:hypothetical protein